MSDEPSKKKIEMANHFIIRPKKDVKIELHLAGLAHLFQDLEVFTTI